MVEPKLDTLEIDTTRIEEVITSRTRAVLTVHLYGRLACNDELIDICQRHNLLLLEDNAQSHGCQWNQRRTGALGDAAAHSFYPGKTLVLLAMRVLLPLTMHNWQTSYAH